MRHRYHQIGREHVVTIVGTTDYGTVMVTDGFGTDHEVPVGWRPKGTAPPQADEQWTLVREAGGWRLGELVSEFTPVVITGDRSANTVDILRQLLEVCEAHGWIDDQTVP